MKTAIITILLIVTVTMCGCIETRSYDTHITAEKQIYTIGEMETYLQDGDITAGFGELQITLHPDKTVTAQGQTGTWIKTGTKNEIWSCSIRGIDKVDYVYLHNGRGAVASYVTHNGTENSRGLWFK